MRRSSRCLRSKRAPESWRRYGADVIDLGVSAGHAVSAPGDKRSRICTRSGFKVSADSLEPDELLRAGLAGADYLLSLREDTLWIADEVASTPILIPREPGDLASLERAMRELDRRQRPLLRRPGARSDPFRLHRFDRPLPCVCARASATCRS